MQETTLLHHVFGGYQRTQNLCTLCGNVSASFEPFLMLSVEMDADCATIEDTLARWVLHAAHIHDSSALLRADVSLGLIFALDLEYAIATHCQAHWNLRAPPEPKREACRFTLERLWF
jgi:hypothetical protein